jgi:type IV pili sensor histidine kinase/response regulator
MKRLIRAIPMALRVAGAGLILLSGCTAHHPRKLSTRQTESEVKTTPVMVIDRRPSRTGDPIALQTDRYSYIAAKPTSEQINPLLTLIDVRLPHDILTVEQAVEYLLQRSGYHLGQDGASNSNARDMLVQVIPDVHRHLGPMTLQDALITLSGPPFRLLVDPVNRQVAFELDPNFQGAGGKAR